MFKIYILPVLDEDVRKGYRSPGPIILTPDYEKSADAELRALRWLYYCPDDIVTIIELETGECVHCGRSIEENAGWLVHKWVHVGDGYTCRNALLTRATPKEAKK